MTTQIAKKAQNTTSLTRKNWFARFKEVSKNVSFSIEKSLGIVRKEILNDWKGTEEGFETQFKLTFGKQLKEIAIINHKANLGEFIKSIENTKNAEEAIDIMEQAVKDGIKFFNRKTQLQAIYKTVKQENENACIKLEYASGKPTISYTNCFSKYFFIK
jgi:hypothetical protein